MEITDIEPNLYDWAESLLMKTALFEGLGRTASRVLIRSAQLVRLDGGETLIGQGMPSDSFFLLLDGKVSVYHARKNGDSVLLGEVESPATVGEIGLLIGAPRTATVVADTAIQAMRFRDTGFTALFETLEGFGLHISRVLAKRIDELSQKIHKAEGDPFADNIIYDIGQPEDEHALDVGASDN